MKKDVKRCLILIDLEL